jgi:hypothetical protein
LIPPTFSKDRDEVLESQFYPIRTFLNKEKYLPRSSVIIDQQCMRAKSLSNNPWAIHPRK